MKLSSSRRRFIKQSSLAVTGMSIAGAMPLQALAAKKKIAASDMLNVGVIGCKGMGWSNMRSHLLMDNVNCIALADIDDSVLDMRAGDVMKARGKKPTLYKDYRKLLENKDVDAVIIGTPDHWHCLNFVDALEAGKHIYCEKPLANSIEEAYVMLNAAERHPNQMVQIGQWQRSGSHYANAIDFVRSGKLGKIRLVKAWAYQGWMKPVPKKPNKPAPEGVDYKMWLGPAPERPFNENRFHFNFRWFWDYAGGLMTDWGVHEIDIALYAMNAIAPKSVIASGGKLAYPDDASETPDTMQAVFEYDGFNMLWEHGTGIDNGPYGRPEGIAFIGNNGTLVVNRQGWEIIPETEFNGDLNMTEYKMEDIPDQGRGSNYLDDHTRNFTDAIRKNDASILRTPIVSGSVAAINAHMGNIALKTGRKIYWDQDKKQFKNDEEANQIMKADYHNDWKLPKM